MNKEEFIKEVAKLGINMTEEQLNQLDQFYKILVTENEKINLTRITNEEDVYLKHFYDSLTIVKVVDLNQIESMCDVGSGAGFPGIVLKIIYPHLKVTLVDSLLKRVKYLNNTIKKLNLEQIEAIHIRSEEYKEKFDLVTARAVANIEKLVKYTMHLVNKNGIFVAMKGDITTELSEEVKQKLKQKYKLERIEKFILPNEQSKRSLILIRNKY